ncbi:hypothetical protein Leryth_016857, partial [Lithospermum erythrorhizon]
MIFDIFIFSYQFLNFNNFLFIILINIKSISLKFYSKLGV